MASKIIAQLIVQSVTVISRAFLTAYQQALRNAKSGGASAATVATIKNKLPPDEALKILHIERANFNRKAVEDSFKRNFDANDPGKGGSFYLQSKIYRSKEVLLKELETAEAGGVDNKDEEAKK